MPKFKEFADNVYTVPMINKEKSKKMNPKTNRMKTSKKTKFHTTEVKPEDRTFKNIPKYSTGKNKVRFQDWLLIKGEKTKPDHSVNSIGYSESLKGYVGWSHRAVSCFKPGDEVKGDDHLGKKVEYPKLANGEMDFDNGKYEKDFTIKDMAHAKEVATTFASNVS